MLVAASTRLPAWHAPRHCKRTDDAGCMHVALSLPAGLPETSANLGQVTPSWTSSARRAASFTIEEGPRSMNTPALRRMQDLLDRLVRCSWAAVQQAGRAQCSARSV